MLGAVEPTSKAQLFELFDFLFFFEIYYLFDRKNRSFYFSIWKLGDCIVSCAGSCLLAVVLLKLSGFKNERLDKLCTDIVFLFRVHWSFVHYYYYNWSLYLTVIVFHYWFQKPTLIVTFNYLYFSTASSNDDFENPNRLHTTPPPPSLVSSHRHWIDWAWTACCCSLCECLSYVGDKFSPLPHFAKRAGLGIIRALSLSVILLFI